MTSEQQHWMRYSITLSSYAAHTELKVGAVLVSSSNNLICYAYSGEIGNSNWCRCLLSKIRQLGISSAHTLYLTINTVNPNNTFDLAEVMGVLDCSTIFIGLPDPSLTCYLQHDPITNLRHIFRYPDALQKEILELNRLYYSTSKQSLANIPYYYTKRVSQLVADNLKEKGFNINQHELETNKSRHALISYLCYKYTKDYNTIADVVDYALSKAFNHKYGDYSYENDVRSLTPGWKNHFLAIYRKLLDKPLPDINIINVGVGGGCEALILFSDCKSITFVDIASNGLNKISQRMHSAKTVQTSADNLFPISANSYDLYVSLRTYNSSFFDIQMALSEAHRVLKSEAILIISVANAFLIPDKKDVVPGLIIPGTMFIDIYRGMNTAKAICNALYQVGFENIQLYPTDTEIYISAFNKE